MNSTLTQHIANPVVNCFTRPKAVRATLYQPDVEAEFVLELGDATERMVRAHGDFDGKPVSYTRRRGEAGPRRDPLGRAGKDSGADAQHERRPPVD